ncbi:RraA family protein [Pseudomonas sp. BN415]|uniref:RraA family protein n=1 Tax=Pseudomonas sp. BN415 TaxID=2567889 RepID=UPI0024577E7E|nr:RraA family protein [Pseudomonas sp. BN415]MDH4583187.1 RraA family protein [Pseudomonas sp. BN415]
MFKIRAMPEPLPSAITERALAAEPATIGHVRLMGFPDSAIRPMHPVPRIAGPAVTLALPAADSSLLHHAVGKLRPGDVVVIDRLGDRHHACLGGGVAYALAQAGVAGVIIDGPIADPGELRDVGLAVWARGVASITTRLQGIGGLMNVPVSCGGAVVQPGDLVIADEGGVVFIPRDEAMGEIERAIQLQEMEKRGLPLISESKTLGDLTGASAMVMAKLDQ